MQERAAWEGVAEELLRKDPAAAARFEKLAEAERRVSELMVPLPAAAHAGLVSAVQRGCRCLQLHAGILRLHRTLLSNQ